MDEKNSVPGTGWFQLGDLRAYINRRTVSALIALAGAIFATFSNEIIQGIEQAPLPDKVKVGLGALATWAAAAAYDYAFPQRARSKKRGK